MQDDWALVVGVSKYPGLTNLEGPENDATAFYEWVVSAKGGNVPKEHTALVLSSNYPPAATPRQAQPCLSVIENAFDDLQDIADKNAAAGNGRRTGRRLYIYLSGHGCAPRLHDSALLTAEATRKRAGYHVLGKLFADWFLRANFFDEAVLFMDCCRESYEQTVPRFPPYIPITGPDALDKAKTFYGFGTKWSRMSRERRMPNGKVHGVFTYALLQGLEGDACDLATGEITAMTLGNYLFNHMKRYLRDEDLADPEVPKEPDLHYDPNPNNRFIFAKVPVKKFQVVVSLPPTSAGETLEIVGSDLRTVAEVVATPPEMRVDLKRGTYMAQILAIGSQSGPFEVTSKGDTHVSL